jgi:hypothetical protein
MIFYFMFSHKYDLIAQFTTTKMKGIISFLSPNRRECFRINEKICRKNPVFSGKKIQKIQKNAERKNNFFHFCCCKLSD